MLHEGSNLHCDARTGQGGVGSAGGLLLGGGLVHTSKNLYIPLCALQGGEILVSSRLGPRMKSVWNMNRQVHDNMSALPRQNDGDDGYSKCTATGLILLL